MIDHPRSVIVSRNLIYLDFDLIGFIVSEKVNGTQALHSLEILLEIYMYAYFSGFSVAFHPNKFAHHRNPEKDFTFAETHFEP